MVGLVIVFAFVMSFLITFIEKMTGSHDDLLNEQERQEIKIQDSDAG